MESSYLAALYRRGGEAAVRQVAGDEMVSRLNLTALCLTGKSNTSQLARPIKGVTASKASVPQMPKGIQKLFAGPSVVAGAGPKAAIAPKKATAAAPKSGVSLMRAPKAPGMR